MRNFMKVILDLSIERCIYYLFDKKNMIELHPLKKVCMYVVKFSLTIIYIIRGYFLEL